MMKCIRTWTRDGTRNEMDIKAAAHNLFANCADPKVRALGLVGIADLLKTGKRLYTHYATFEAVYYEGRDKR